MYVLRYSLLLFVLYVCMVAYGYSQPNYAQSWYKPFRGQVMGAEATLYLHHGASGLKGYLVLTRDPRPYYTQEPWDAHRQGDSLLLRSTRSPGLIINLRMKWQGENLTGAAEMLADPELVGNERSLRKGTVSFVRDTMASSFVYQSRKKDEVLAVKTAHPPAFHYSSATVWPGAHIPGTLATSVRQQILNFFEQKTTVVSAEAMLVAHEQRQLTPWKKEMMAVPVSELKNWGVSMLEQEHKCETLVMYEGPLMLVLANQVYFYAGGVHGNYRYELVSFDKRTGKPLKLQDVITPSGVAQLPRLLEVAFRQQFGFAAGKTLEQNGALVKTVKPNDQFFVADAGIGFWYSPYELMPFVYNNILLFLPLATVQSFLQPSFIQAGK